MWSFMTYLMHPLQTPAFPLSTYTHTDVIKVIIHRLQLQPREGTWLVQSQTAGSQQNYHSLSHTPTHTKLHSPHHVL